jgi:hypothetical protein
MSESVIYAISIVLLIGVCGLGFWFARQSLGLGGVPLFAPKHRRLGVVESAYVDSRRRLLLVRRDNVEHLIMIGGPVDMLVETGITPQRPAIIGLEQPAGSHGALNGRDLASSVEEAKIPLTRDVT